MTSARERILDAFEQILRTEGERAATIDAVARAAGVSKGGALYHFPSKEALADGMCDRLRRLGAEDAAAMQASPEGPAHYYVRHSQYLGTPFDHALIAVSLLHQAGHEHARTVLKEIEAAWMSILEQALADPVRARAVKLLGDGLYYAALQDHGGLDAPATPDPGIEELLTVVDQITSP